MDQRAKQLADKALMELAQSLDKGHSHALTAYLKTMAKFHHYSWFNAMLIWLQRPDATRVAGFRRWQQLGRCVKQGEKGVMILAPCTYRRRPIAGESKEEEDQSRATIFTTAWVFDFKQTEGKPLPAIGERYGDPGIYARRLVECAETLGIQVSLVDDLGGAHGRSRGGTLEVLQGLAPADRFAVMAHELAHEILHQGENKGKKPKIVRETEAEAVAFVIASAVGLDNGTAARDYIHLYQSDSKLLMESLASIQKASSMILKEILDHQ
jgi:hypothetical protein